MNWLERFLYNFLIDPAFGRARSGEWDRVRKEHIKQHPECAICGKVVVFKNNDVHHILPFWKHPEKELDPLNLITLCPKHHFELGHFFKWSSWNEKIEQLAEDIKNRP